MFRWGFLSTLFFVALVCTGQAIDPAPGFRIIPGERYFRIHYENDYFSSSDRYFTQGVLFEFAHPSIKKFPIAHLLPGSGRKAVGTRIYGLSLEHDGYTPTDISSETIQYGDRPFAAALMLNTFLFVNNPGKHRFHSTFSIGVLGPAAGGKEVQSTIHKWIDDELPEGWKYQIQNAAVINMEIGWEKNLIRSGEAFMVNGSAVGRAGTYNTKAQCGVNVMFGKLDADILHVFAGNVSERRRKSTFRWHAYAQSVVNAVAYDATLQGGLFNHENPYTIPSDEVSRITAQVNYGLVLHGQWIHLEYFQSFLTREFETGYSHRWGGIRLGFKI